MKISTWIPVAAVAFNAAFAGGGQPPDTCYFDAGLRGVALDKTLTRPDDAFLVRKLYDGEHSVRTDLSTVELAVYSAAAANPDAHGGCLTYLIEGEGIDITGNTDDNGERFKLNGIYDIAQQNHYMVEFDDAGWTRITAKLKEGGAIRVTGVFGPYNPEYADEAPNGMDRRKTLSTAGLLTGQTFYVIERSTPFGNGYEPTGYVYEGDDAAADPRVDATDMTATQKLSQDITDETDPIPADQPSYTPATVPAGALFLKGVVTGSATTVFVVNKIDESKVGTIEVDVTDWDAPYDGEGHGVAVTMLSTFSDDEGEPLYDWWRASYALGDAEGPTNDWSAGTPLFTNVCEQTVWMAFDADYWRSTTTSAVVRIRPAALAITARDQTYVYNGRPQGEGDPVYTDPADIAAKVDVEGLAAGDALASIVLTGQRTEPGTEWIVPSGAVVTNATGDVTSNYDIGYTNGTLTIGAPAPPSVSNVVARQRWPWNGLVDVDYEVGGTTTGLVARISFAEQGGDGRSWVATNFLAGAEPSVEPGPHRATWNTAADGATNVVAAKVTATVELVREPPVSDGNVWSLIGDFNSWGGDVDMTLTDGKWVSPVTKITAGGFKIRFNHDWTENVGGVMEDLGIPFAAISGGDNISIEEGNDYVVTYDPDDQTILVEFIGWGVVGTINSWGGSADLAMKEENGMFVRKNVTLAADDEINVRYRNSWDVNYGGRTDVGFAVEAISGGDNLKPGAGTYDIWLDAEKKALFVMKAGEAPEYWGVVGNINSWGGTPDAVMYHDAEGYFVAKGIALAADDEIKIRKNSDWTDNRGASDAAPDTALDAVAGGDSIKVAAGTYDVYYQSASEKIYVMTAGKTPADAQ